jgi:hypothetical protein
MSARILSLYFPILFKQGDRVLVEERLVLQAPVEQAAREPGQAALQAQVEGQDLMERQEPLASTEGRVPPEETAPQEPPDLLAQVEHLGRELRVLLALQGVLGRVAAMGHPEQAELRDHPAQEGPMG